VERAEAGRSVRVDERTLSTEERLEEALFMGLRLTEGIDLEAMHRQHGVDVTGRYGDELSRFVDLGLLVHDPGRRLALTREGMLVANEIMVVFIGGTVR
jgi:oxygen-independent coproporphyrinogen III oxidase